MTTVIRNFMVLPLFLISTHMMAQQAKTMSLRQCIDMALTTNYSVKALDKSVERAKDMQKTAWNLDKTELSLGQDPTSGGSPDNALAISQQIEFPTVYLAKGKMLKAETQMERSKAAIGKKQLEADIASVYYQMLYRLEQLRVLKRQGSIIAKFCDMANNRVLTGEARQLEKLSMDRKLMDNRQAILSAKTELGSLQRQMMGILNVTEAILPIEKNLTAIDWNVGEYNYSSTLDGQYAQDKVTVADKAITVAKNVFAPSLSISLRRQFFISSWNPYRVDRSKFDGGNFMGFEVSVGVPLFWGAARARLKVAKRNREIAELELRQDEARQKQEYSMLLNKLVAARENLNYYTEERELHINKMADLAEIGYKNGDISYIELTNLLDDCMDHDLKKASAINEYNQVIISLLAENGESMR